MIQYTVINIQNISCEGNSLHSPCMPNVMQLKLFYFFLLHFFFSLFLDYYFPIKFIKRTTFYSLLRTLFVNT